VKYARFEELPVWKAAARLFVDVLTLTRRAEVGACGDLVNQLRRATLSISNNIAEGFERGSTAELISFLYYARGSAGEARSMLTIMLGLDQMQDFKSEISDLRSSAESISRQLGAWLRSLQDTDIKGERHLNQAARAQYDRKIRAEAFLRKLEGAKQGEPRDADDE
jgi:four helix bundle protein